MMDGRDMGLQAAVNGWPIRTGLCGGFWADGQTGRQTETLMKETPAIGDAVLRARREMNPAVQETRSPEQKLRRWVSSRPRV
jgi:hypothetical protein